MINSYKHLILFLGILFATQLYAFSEVSAATSLQGSPTASTRITSGYGKRSCSGCSSMHRAIDIGGTRAGVAGDRISSTHGGRVVESRYQTNGAGTSGWGNTVVVESASGNYRTRYSHMQNSGLANGSTVAPGTQIGNMGGTGRTGGYGVHLDYAVDRKSVV